MTDKEQLSRGDALARVVVLETELAELRTKNIGLQKLHMETEDELLEKVRDNGRLRTILASADSTVEPFQQRVQTWMLECFGQAIAADRAERNHRFLEEALELVQSLGCTADEASRLVCYVYGRPTGEPVQEAGGVMVTLAALCLANDMDIAGAGEKELARISQPDTVLRIREKQRNKPSMSPLPGVYPERAAPVKRVEQEAVQPPVAWQHRKPIISDIHGNAKEWSGWIDGQGLAIWPHRPLYAAPQPAAPCAPPRDVIRATLMAHGFTVKIGQNDLKPYVYEAVEALFARPAPAAQDVAGLVEALQLFVRWVDMEQSENVTAGVFDRLKAFRNAETKARAVLAAHQSGGAK